MTGAALALVAAVALGAASAMASDDPHGSPSAGASLRGLAVILLLIGIALLAYGIF